MAAPEEEFPDLDDGKKALDSFMTLCHAVADANAGAGSSIDPQPAPKASAAPAPAATPPAAAWADEPALTPQQPAHPPPWWAWRQRAEEAGKTRGWDLRDPLRDLVVVQPHFLRPIRGSASFFVPFEVQPLFWGG